MSSTAIVGGVLGKRAINGPMFSENVSMNGQTVVITGANTGLGKESAIMLLKLGARCILLCKNEARAATAIKEIKKECNSDVDVSSLTLDLADLSSVKRCARQLRNELDKIDVLMLNAGVMAIPERSITADGFEAHMSINHLGHFALTGLLLPLLQRAPLARVVSVSSTAHLFGDLDFQDLMLANEGNYERWRAYGNSKLANILFVKGLAARLGSQDANIVPVACHPGVCRTELARSVVEPLFPFPFPHCSD